MAVMIAAVVVVCFLTWYTLLVVPTQWLKLEFVKWNATTKTTVLQVSDIHIEMNRALKSVVRVIDDIRPDYIFLTGDYLDTLKAMPQLKQFLDRIQAFRIPTFAVLGNHDYLLHDVNLLVQLLESKGITVLRNESISLPEFRLVGIDDFCTGHANIDKAFRNLDAGHASDERVFVITHDADVVLQLERHYDALIAGHLHGKQFNLPFLFQLQPMGPLAAQGIYKGIHHTGFGTYYISKGVGQSGYNYRLFVRSEITVHRF